MPIITRPRSLFVLALLALAAAWLAASSASDDDRGPIIVRAGSLIFENGPGPTPAMPWIQDDVLDEWKPLDNSYQGIKGFEVTFEHLYAPSTCAGTALAGDQVDIEYTTGAGKVVPTRVRKRRAHGLGLYGKQEPKIDPRGNALRVAVSSTPQLVLDDATRGYISKVTVGKVSCDFPAPPPAPDPAREKFLVRIQPKADHP